MKKVPILILAYNRPDHSKKLLNRLKLIKPKSLYINIDGPKDIKDKINCNLTIKCWNSINWKCKVSYKINKKNFGCRKSVISALRWFFKKEKMGIILEDDCIPSESFFKYCNLMLNIYKNSNVVGAISGNNFSKEKRKKDIYFSKYFLCWGWATWRRSFNLLDATMKNWPKFQKSKIWNNLFDLNIEKKYWKKILNYTKNQKIDSWAYVWMFSMWCNRSLTILPKKNLVKNIGFDDKATHTNNLKSEFNLYKSYKLNIKKENVLKYKIYRNRSLDKDLFNNHFKGKNFIWPYRIIFLINLIISNPLFFFKKLKNFIF